MLKITPETKVYVHCPANLVTGGAELLHQLVHTLNCNNIDTYIIYDGDLNVEIPLDYIKSYNIKKTSSIDDNENNVEVIYETRLSLVNVNKKIQKLLWWLSVDNFYLASFGFISPIDIWKFNKNLSIKAFIHQLFNFLTCKNKFLLNPLKIKHLTKVNASNAYQSEYAQYFLQSNGFKEVIALKDYINPDHRFSEELIPNKKNIVLYNPKKGFKFTKKLIEAAPDIEWIALEGMNREQLIQKISEAKIYIDFGNHPGKDRLPRECAMNGCCVITGYRGSAAFYEDVQIPDKYKFKDDVSQIPLILNTFKYIFENYETALKDFDNYRKTIRDEKKEFETQIAKIFGYYV